MAGSQLKKLKEALKVNGLSGPVQQSKKGRGRKGKQSKDYDREERQRVISKIREEFNPFDIKTNRNKKGNIEEQHNRSKSAPDSKIAVGKPGISKQIGEEQRQQVYSAKKSLKGKASAFLDKRFGERNKVLTEEEKMLERFTRERQHESAKKKSLFNLEDDEDDTGFSNDADIYGTKLTHYGQSLALDDDFQEDDLGFDEPMSGKRRGLDGEQRDGRDGEEEGPQRKKTKAEVMKEVIAKSKYYKQERQKKQEDLLDQIQDLDDNFDDLMSELQTMPKNQQQQGSTKFVEQSKAVEEGFKDYDIKVKELGMEKRAAPSERTKTEEELQKEKDDKMKKLEQDRLNRMNGIFEFYGEEDEENKKVDVEQLDDGFWGDSEEELEMEDANIPDSDDDIKLSDDEDEKNGASASAHKTRSIPSVPCPQTHDELIEFLVKYPAEEHVALIKRIIRTFQPKLAEGNKQKMNIFAGVVLRHIMALSSEDYSDRVEEMEQTQKQLIQILKLLSEKYNRGLTECCRTITTEIQQRYEEDGINGLNPGDLVFFSIVGYLFSTSDHYHLVVTPCNILMGEFLEQLVYKEKDLRSIIFSTILSQIVIKYQVLSKRFFPEVSYFLLQSFKILFPACSGHQEKLDSVSLPLHLLFKTKFDSSIKNLVLQNQLQLLDSTISDNWKNLSAFPEISLPFQAILDSKKEYPLVESINEKITKLLSHNVHNPLTLQNHKPLAIPTYAPKYEENFNPEKKSYSTDRTRNDIDKMKAQLKKERKFTMKEIRKDSRFEGRQQIDEKKKDQQEYHAKMARIINTINTEEGAEKNKYEREKKLRSGKK